MMTALTPECEKRTIEFGRIKLMRAQDRLAVAFNRVNEADLFDMQDEIVARLANALNAQLVAAEARRAEKAPNPAMKEIGNSDRQEVGRGLQQSRGEFASAVSTTRARHAAQR